MTYLDPYKSIPHVSETVSTHPHRVSARGRARRGSDGTPAQCGRVTCRCDGG
jgi:hypothetical protein